MHSNTHLHSLNATCESSGQCGAFIYAQPARKTSAEGIFLRVDLDGVYIALHSAELTNSLPAPSVPDWQSEQLGVVVQGNIYTNAQGIVLD